MSASANHFSVRPEWLATHDEEALDPSQSIVDSHHHLYDRPGLRYLMDDYLADLAGGHDVRASVFVQARAMLRAEGPEQFRSIGETEFVNGVAAMSASGIYGKTRVCAGIVGFADLMQGDGVRGILERLVMAGGGLVSEGGRFCGIRQPLCWDSDAGLLNAAYPTSEDMMDSSAFRAGFAHLARLGLSFDAWLFFPQLPRLARLARTFPDTMIAVDHCGGVVQVGDFGARPDVYGAWKVAISELATCPNVAIKLSGLGMRLSAFGFDERSHAPSSVDLSEKWRPWVEHAIESFGPERCMWGSNFPVDKGSYACKVGLNAFKRLASTASPAEKDSIFWRTAAIFYRLPTHLFDPS